MKLSELNRSNAEQQDLHSYESSPSEMIVELGWQNLQERRRILRLVLFYKIVHGDVAIPVGDILTTADSRTRAPHQYKYKHIGANVDSYKHSYFPKTIRDWDTLSEEQVTAKTAEEFKRSLKAKPPDPPQHQ